MGGLRAQFGASQGPGRGLHAREDGQRNVGPPPRHQLRQQVLGARMRKRKLLGGNSEPQNGDGYSPARGNYSVEVWAVSRV